MKLYLKTRILLATCIFGLINLYERAAATTKICEQSFSTRDENTDDLISYLDHLFLFGDFPQNKIIAWLQEAAQGHVQNPIPENLSMVGGMYTIHRNAFRELIVRDLNIEKLKIWAAKNLKKLLSDSHEKDVVIKSTAAAALPMKFHPIEPAEFEVDMMDKKTWKVRPTILRFDHHFEMMDAPVTQYWFATVSASNPSHFRTGLDSGVTVVDGKEINILPDNPVENLDWYHAIHFANQLSINAGLKPAYIWDEKLEFFVANAAGNDILLTEGYRLPTIVEYFYIQTHGGARKTPFASKEEALQYAWLRQNSDNRTQPVKLLAPIFAQGKSFYDILGNVSVWSNDSKFELHGSGKAMNNQVRALGFSYNTNIDSSIHWHNPQYEGYMPPDWKTPSFGVRLVRTLHVREN